MTKIGVPVVKPYPATETKPGVEVSKVIAKWDFVALNDTQLGFVTGDIIEVILQDIGAPGWWSGRLQDKEGIIPANYVHVIEELEKKKKKYTINQKKVSRKIKELRALLSVHSDSFKDIEPSNMEKPEAPATVEPSRVIATVARRKNLPENARGNIISFFDSPTSSRNEETTEMKEENGQDIEDLSPDEMEDTKKENVPQVEYEGDYEEEYESESESESESEEWEENEEEEAEENEEEETSPESETYVKPSEIEDSIEESGKEEEPLLQELVGSPVPVPTNVMDLPPVKDLPKSPAPSNRNQTSPQRNSRYSLDEEGEREIPALPNNLLWRCFERCSIL